MCGVVVHPEGVKGVQVERHGYRASVWVLLVSSRVLVRDADLPVSRVWCCILSWLTAFPLRTTVDSDGGAVRRFDWNLNLKRRLRHKFDRH